MNDTSTRVLTIRLWRSYVRQHGKGIALALVCTLAVAGLTALYPIVIQQAFDLFTAGDERVLWLIPLVIIVVTSSKALAQFGQAVSIQSVVLRVVENLQREDLNAIEEAEGFARLIASRITSLYFVRNHNKSVFTFT